MHFLRGKSECQDLVNEKVKIVSYSPQAVLELINWKCQVFPQKHDVKDIDHYQRNGREQYAFRERPGT